MMHTAEPLPVDVVLSATDVWLIALTGVGIVVTAVIAALTLRANVKANKAADKANEALTSAVNAYTEAAQAAAAATNAQTEVIRLIAQQREEPTSTEPQVISVSWQLARRSSMNWELRNLGGATARRVTIRGVSTADRESLVVPPLPTDVPPGGHITFNALHTLGGPPAISVIVSWEGVQGHTRMQQMVVPG